jgi:hypothetical protein
MVWLLRGLALLLCSEIGQGFISRSVFRVGWRFQSPIKETVKLKSVRDLILDNANFAGTPIIKKFNVTTHRKDPLTIPYATDFPSSVEPYLPLLANEELNLGLQSLFDHDISDPNLPRLFYEGFRKLVFLVSESSSKYKVRGQSLWTEILGIMQIQEQIGLKLKSISAASFQEWESFLFQDKEVLEKEFFELLSNYLEFSSKRKESFFQLLGKHSSDYSNYFAEIVNLLFEKNLYFTPMSLKLFEKERLIEMNNIIGKILL